MGEAARQLTDAERALVNSVPSVEQYSNKDDAAAIKALRNLSEVQQLKVLRALGVTPENPLSVSGHFRRNLLDVIAQVGFKVDSTGKGRNPAHISTPTGGKKR